MKDKITKFIKYEAAFWVAIFLLFFVSAIAVNTIIKTTSVRAAESLTELQKKKKLEEERAKKAKELNLEFLWIHGLRHNSNNLMKKIED